MKKFISAVLGCALAASSVAVPASASSAMPTIWSASKADEAAVQEARHHRRHGYHHRRHYHRHRGHGYGGAAAAAGIIGLGVGAAIAAGAAERDRDAYYADRERDEYCFSKYRSYDPRTGTYLGYDGYRHPCR